MKKKLLFLFSFFAVITISVIKAQEIETLPDKDDQSSEKITQPAKPIDTRDFYLGFGTGINYTGLYAITGEFNLYKNLSLLATAGVGSWGYKLLANLHYYKKFPKGIYYCGGFSYSTGIPEIELELETSSGNEEKVLLELKPVVNVDIGIGYAFRLWKRGRLNLEFGYAIDATSGDAYKLKDTQPELSDTSEKLMKLMKPGGFRFGLNLNIGL
jgi:hypothetical protein